MSKWAILIEKERQCDSNWVSSLGLLLAHHYYVCDVVVRLELVEGRTLEGPGGDSQGTRPRADTQQGKQ